MDMEILMDRTKELYYEVLIIIANNICKDRDMSLFSPIS